MLFLKYLLFAGGVATIGSAAALVGYDLYLTEKYRRMVASGTTTNLPAPTPVRWRDAGKIAAWAFLPLLLAATIEVVPSGKAGVRVSQVSGTRPGTLYPGIHFVKPFVERVALFDIRERVFTTEAVGLTEKTDKKPEVLTVQAREGLSVGLAVVVRYRLDPKRLDYIESSLPQPVEEELVPPTVTSTFRDIVSAYTVRDVFAVRREEIRRRAAEEITKKLGADGVLVKEVAVRDIKLPQEYAKGLEGLLLKEQENDRLVFETEIQQKHVRIAELEAEATKVQEVKRAEGAAQVRVLQAKAESDAMQFTLPLKEKQIQQVRLESEARKESTIKTAEAAAQAKVIDSKAELERRRLMADAEANRIRVTSSADAERMKNEAVALKQNPLLINKIIAEKLSDKVQIMMVPSDGKFFLTNELMKGVTMPSTRPQENDPDDPPEDTVNTPAVSRFRVR